jgi:hypothetical protein
MRMFQETAALLYFKLKPRRKTVDLSTAGNGAEFETGRY